jgi:hypothetical protein
MTDISRPICPFYSYKNGHIGLDISETEIPKSVISIFINGDIGLDISVNYTNLPSLTT